MDLISLLLDRMVDKVSGRHPLLIGVPLLLLPIFVMAGLVYFLAHMY